MCDFLTSQSPSLVCSRFLSVKYTKKCEKYRKFNTKITTDRLNKLFLTIYTAAEINLLYISKSPVQNSNQNHNHTKMNTKMYNSQTVMNAQNLMKVSRS